MKRINEPESIGEEFWGCFGEDFQWLKKQREPISSR